MRIPTEKIHSGTRQGFPYYLAPTAVTPWENSNWFQFLCLIGVRENVTTILVSLMNQQRTYYFGSVVQISPAPVLSLRLPEISCTSPQTSIECAKLSISDGTLADFTGRPLHRVLCASNVSLNWWVANWEIVMVIGKLWICAACMLTGLSCLERLHQQHTMTLSILKKRQVDRLTSDAVNKPISLPFWFDEACSFHANATSKTKFSFRM